MASVAPATTKVAQQKSLSRINNDEPTAAWTDVLLNSIEVVIEEEPALAQRYSSRNHNLCEPQEEELFVEVIAAEPPSFRPVTGFPILHPGNTQSRLSIDLSRKINRYIIEKEFLSDAVGKKVFKAWDPVFERPVLLKAIACEAIDSNGELVSLKERVYREARVVSKLKQPDIATIYDIEEDDECIYLVMEFVEGKSLKQRLLQEHRLDCRPAIEIIINVCEALEHAHRSDVYHGNIKPANIMCLKNGGIKILDFGMVKSQAYRANSQRGGEALSYLAPEQIEKREPDARSDLFSLGAVFYELLTGKRPFVAESALLLAKKITYGAHIPPSLENLEIPIELDETLSQALAKRPKDRFQNVAELKRSLIKVMKFAI